ncbi:hypothetical protein ACH5RR_031998 [Cinchona calisaya]|uniref:RNase H type-1 domain-containing protein n=1 Tax=Cinchona calisaya TaxID=153742 RepID=A0ABD2YGV5_9GENT
MQSGFPRSSTKKPDSNAKENTQNKKVTSKAVALINEHNQIPNFKGNKETELQVEEKDEEGDFTKEKTISHDMMWIDEEPAKTCLENVFFGSEKNSNKKVVIDKTSPRNVGKTGWGIVARVSRGRLIKAWPISTPTCKTPIIEESLAIKMALMEAYKEE